MIFDIYQYIHFIPNTHGISKHINISYANYSQVGILHEVIRSRYLILSEKATASGTGPIVTEIRKPYYEVGQHYVHNIIL